MIFYLLCLITLGMIIFYTVRNIRTDGWKEGLACMLPSSAIGCSVVLLIVTVVTSLALTNWDQYYPTTREVHPIVSLRTDKDFQGSFMLGCGHVGSEEKYYFMYDLGNSQYMRGSCETWKVTIRESNDEKPNLSFQNFIRTNRKVFKWWPEAFVPEYSGSTGYVLTVPKGTVLQHFEVK